CAAADGSPCSMADRICVTSLMGSSITAARVTGQRRGVSPQEVAGCLARSKTHALELLACGLLPGRFWRRTLSRATTRFIPTLQNAFTGRLRSKSGCRGRTVADGRERGRVANSPAARYLSAWGALGYDRQAGSPPGPQSGELAPGGLPPPLKWPRRQAGWSGRKGPLGWREGTDQRNAQG